MVKVCRARKALSKGTNIVLANKAPLVLAYQDLMMLASLKPVSQVLFSATVCGGLPVVNVGRRDLCCGRIRSVRGIFNSTSNFILSQMENGNSRKEALQIAMERGIAEADPTLDVEGIDTANKLTIIANSILEYSVTLADVSVEGISNVTTLDMEEAKRDGKVIRLVASAIIGATRRHWMNPILVIVYLLPLKEWKPALFWAVVKKPTCALYSRAQSLKLSV